MTQHSKLRNSTDFFYLQTQVNVLQSGYASGEGILRLALELRQVMFVKSVYAPLTFSPHADVPLCTLSPREQAALYHSRTEEHFSPYTVERVLREVYRRDFGTDLTA